MNCFFFHCVLFLVGIVLISSFGLSKIVVRILVSLNIVLCLVGRLNNECG